MKNIHPLLSQRWSPRAFSPKKIDAEIITRLFEAARWAPSSMNEQPWRFVYGQNPSEAFEKISNLLVPGNNIWASKAPLLIATIGKTNFDYKNRDNRTWMHDLGLAVSNLVFQATVEGLYVHQMGGVKLEEMREELQIPAGYEPVTIMAVGYIGQEEDLPEGTKQGRQEDRERLSLEEICFEGFFKNSKK